jgi:sigma-B regulation protein RsbU (phosphoserine phosphatase)
MDHHSDAQGEEPKLVNLLREDLHRGDFQKTVRRDFKELKEFFLNKNRKKRLEQMGWFRRGMYTFGWMLKSLFLKLTPARRILVLISIAFLFLSRNFQTQGEHTSVDFNFTIIGALILLFILMLELKDKLLARNELEAGRAVQNAFMPERNPAVPGWSLWLFTRTANEVGGDLVDFQKIDTNRFGISLADVSGKGLSAALLMAKLQATIRALAPDFVSLSELGKKINKIFCRDSTPTFFASLVYLEFKAESGSVRLVNAGHLPPILVQGKEIQEMKKGDAAIGLIPESTYAEQQIELEKGDIVLIYSDGITDAKNEANEFFGAHRLLQILPKINELSTQEIGEKILKEIYNFIVDTPLYDDLSIVIMKRVI